MTLRPEYFDSHPVNGYVASIRADDESGAWLVCDLARKSGDGIVPRQCETYAGERECWRL